MERLRSFCKFGTLFVGRNERWNTHLRSKWFDKSRDQYLEDKKKGVQAVDKSAEYLDAMSAITCVIDQEKFKRGMGL